MIAIRESKQRGHFDHGWLNTYHSFSFAGYQDEKHMGFRSLRVINEDRVKPRSGFGRHSHREMEIITYIISGELKHEDSSSQGGVIRRGDVQHMSAGKGIMHSEFNSSETETVHFLQIWLYPEKEGLQPSYDQKHFSDNDKHNRLCLIASPDASDGSLFINQDVYLYASLLDKENLLGYGLDDGRAAWIQVISGELEINGRILSAGDGASIEHTDKLNIKAKEQSEFLLFDLK